MTKHLILGTAGHIDHGKTSLIRALTGTNTDRLPEEKKRGITIELGYAVLEIDDFRFGVVDVPGHEKFVRQMLSGATGMDMALLVVAADDSIKRQTTEHLDILRLLDLPGGVIAITKSDTVESDWLEMVEEEIRELVKDTFLADAAIVPTSAHTGFGLDHLKSELGKVANRIATETNLIDPDAPFRMAIDRVFTIEGHGTVVTGSVSSGRADIGDKVEIQPGGLEARVREIQNHDLAVQGIGRGQRGAINLAGVHHGSIKRGQELCSGGHLQPTKMISVRLQLLKNISRPLKDRQRVRFHIGTSEVLASVRLLESKEMNAEGSGLAQLFLSEPIVAVWNQPFVIRTESPLETIGGGRVLLPSADRIKTATETDVEMLNGMSSGDAKQRVASALFFRSLQNNQLASLARVAGVSAPQAIVESLVADGDLVELQLSPQRNLLLHQLAIEQLGQAITKSLKKFHESDPLASGIDRTRLESFFVYLETKLLFEEALKRLIKKKAIVQVGGFYSLEGYGPQLTKNEKLLLAIIIERFAGAGLEPPTIEQVTKEATKSAQSVPQLLQLACDQGQIVKLTDAIFLHRQVIEDIKQKLTNAMAGEKGITMSDIRQLLDTSRKYAIPICEYLDSSGFTRRDGDFRYLVAAVPA